jgi:group I intron endonuclease
MQIYVITNLKNGKQYVGQTTRSIETRWKHHCWYSTAIHTNMPIAKAIKKHGKENFKIEAIETCSTLEELNRRELFWCKKFNAFSPNGYNLRAGDQYIIKKGTIKNIRRSIKPISEETRQKLSESHKGYIVTESTKKKLSELNKGKRGTDYCYERASEVLSLWYKVISPTGDVFIIKNMKKFCNIMDLSPSCMCLVANGKAIHHKKWKCWKL